MGTVTFIDRATGQPVLVDFPLHPGLVGYTRPDGTQGQMYRDDFDRHFGQHVPKLPAVNTAVIPMAGAGEFALPMKDAAPGADGHEAWFQKIWDEITIIRSKVDDLLEAHPVLKASVERIERTVAQSHPTMQALEQAVSALNEKKTDEEPPAA